jgi:hypothetical protein
MYLETHRTHQIEGKYSDEIDAVLSEVMRCPSMNPVVKI